MAIARVVQDYEFRLARLPHFPEKNIIQDLTKFADVHQNIADQLADILIAKIIDVGLA